MNIKFALNDFTTSAYADIFKQKIPLLDVRSPVEFAKGSFIEATNIPILSDAHRAKVGISYKNYGKNSALELGFNLIKEAEKQALFASWKNWYQHNRQGLIYCFRGGLRSKLAQDFLYKEYGFKIKRIAGGYKALRRFMLDTLEQKSAQLEVFLLGGKTGSGKTALLEKLAQSFDLENAADHLGSAFGNKFNHQPSQVDFEHRLADFLLNFKFNKILFEDESRHIGRCQIPASLFTKFQQAPLLVMDINLEERIENIFNEYVIKAQASLLKIHGEEVAMQIYAGERLKSLANIQTKLGLERYKNMRSLLVKALDDLPKKRVALMQTFIERLLVDYYDPMYEWQLQKKRHLVLIEGDQKELADFWGELCSPDNVKKT